MRLPTGVSYHPRKPVLIARDSPGLVQISTAGLPDNAHYVIEDHPFGSGAVRCLHGDLEMLDRLFGLDREGALWSEARHRPESRGDATAPRLGDIIVLPNRRLTEWRGLPRPLTVFGCSMGRTLPGRGPAQGTMALQEFQSHGMLVIDREDGAPELWIGREGDKVAVPAGCHLTLFNLGDEDHALVSLGLATDGFDTCGTDLAMRFGPILSGWYDAFEVVLSLSPLYIDSGLHRAGVRPVDTSGSAEERRIVIPRGGRLDLGAFMYEQLTGNPAVVGRLARMGLAVRKASPEAVLLAPDARQGIARRLHVALPLAEAAGTASEVQRFFQPAVVPRVPGPPAPSGLAEAAAQIAGQRRQSGRPQALNRRLQVLVEGAGDWVVKTFRPIFKARWQDVAVFYADDTRWTWGRRPGWVAHLEPWEVYLDKADSRDYGHYRALLPTFDAVFVSTPDFTHAAIVREMLGVVPCAFVEKPFDSQPEHVADLLRAMGSDRRTFVMGLDHYRAYASAIESHMMHIERHLGGAAARIEFVMAEDQPIELGRERSLQHGLTLDLLPHFLALLGWFGDLATIDEIEVLEASRYEPMVARDPQEAGRSQDIEATFCNETSSRVRFTIGNHTGGAARIRCDALVGKGFSSAARYMEVTGVGGGAVRVDFNRRPAGVDPCPGYPWDALFLLGGPGDAGAPGDRVSDPYNPGRSLHVLPGLRAANDRAKYARLLDSLITGAGDAMEGALLIGQADAVVRALDRIWRAIQQHRPWTVYPLGAHRPTL